MLDNHLNCAWQAAVLTDALAIGPNERGHHLGARSPGTLLRVLACTSGEIQAEVSYAPRPEYGLIHPVLVPVARVARRPGRRPRAVPVDAGQLRLG